MFQTNIHISRGALTTMIISICGGATWAAICQSDANPGIGDIFDMIRLTTGTAAVSGIVVAPLFGMRGFNGLVIALIGAVFATIVGAALAAIAVGGLPGLILGPMFVLSSLVTEPLVGGVWLLIMATAHCVSETERTRP